MECFGVIGLLRSQYKHRMADDFLKEVFSLRSSLSNSLDIWGKLLLETYEKILA